MEADEIMRLVEIEGEERIAQAFARGTGVIFCGSHFGYWELQLMMHGFRHKPMVVVARNNARPY